MSRSRVLSLISVESYDDRDLADERRPFSWTLNVDVHLLAAPILSTVVSTVGFAVAALPVVQPDAQHVALELRLVEVVLVLERRRVADAGRTARAAGFGTSTACVEMLFEQVVLRRRALTPAIVEPPDLGRFAFGAVRLLGEVWARTSSAIQRERHRHRRTRQRRTAAIGRRMTRRFLRAKPRRARLTAATLGGPVNRQTRSEASSGLPVNRVCRSSRSHSPASSASLLGVAAIRLISHSIADCGGIWLSPRRSVYTLSIWSGRKSFSSRRVPLVPMSIAG